VCLVIRFPFDSMQPPSESLRVDDIRWRWRDLPLRLKGIVLIALAILPLVVTAFFLYSVQRRVDQAERSVAQTLHVKSLLDRASTLVSDAELGARNYLVTRSPAAIAGVRTTSANLATVVAEISSLITDQSQRDRLRTFIAHAQGRTLTALIEYAQKSPAGAPLPIDLISRSNEAMVRLRGDLAAMQTAEDALLVARGGEARRARTRELLTVALGTTGFAAGVAVSLFFMGTLAGRIGAATANARRLAAGEPLLPMAVSRDEVGSLAEALTRTFGLLQSRDLELRRRVDDLAAANAELEAFSYSVSHDLRAPLRHIAGFAALLEKRAADRLDEDSARYLQTIAGAAARMGRLVDDLLAFSRMGRTDMLCKEVNLDDVIRDLVAEATEQSAGRRIHWSTHSLPLVKGDRTMLRVALSNLLSNAVKYTATRPLAEIEIGAQRSTNGERVVYVRDNGVGFDMAYAHKLFGVFQRLHGSDEFEGTGIGLANVRRIVQRHGGRTWAEAELGKGATFYVSLPAAERTMTT
jgi:signal transduction histidine kinase